MHSNTATAATPGNVKPIGITYSLASTSIGRAASSMVEARTGIVRVERGAGGATGIEEEGGGAGIGEKC